MKSLIDIKENDHRAASQSNFMDSVFLLSRKRFKSIPIIIAVSEQIKEKKRGDKNGNIETSCRDYR
jgi:hypothetical protein